MINSIVNTGFQPIVDIRDVGQGAVTSTQPSQIAPPQTTQPDAAQLQAAVSKLNDHVQNVQRNLSFSVDKDSGQTVIRVYDAQTNEVIRQLPPDETLKMAASIEHQLANLFVKERA